MLPATSATTAKLPPARKRWRFDFLVVSSTDEQATSLEPGGATGPPEQRHTKPVGRNCAADGVVREPLVDDGVIYRRAQRGGWG